MINLYWLTDEQMTRLEPYFPESHGSPRIDDQQVLSDIIDDPHALGGLMISRIVQT